ncbi:MAG: DUF721 domain-containing protein [Dysgonomonas sp.]
MRRKNTETIGEVLQEFFEQNEQLRIKIAESRVLSGWGRILGVTVASYTTDIYIRNNMLYVHLSSSVLRNELIMAKDRLIKGLNDYAKLVIVKDIIFK